MVHERPPLGSSPEDKYLEDDSTFNFRVNSQLKKDFSLLCKRRRISSAAALKRYMAKCVESGRTLDVY
jgi:hypothetical protein